MNNFSKRTTTDPMSHKLKKVSKLFVIFLILTTIQPIRRYKNKKIKMRKVNVTSEKETT